MPKRVVVGVVKSDKMAKTRVVVISRKVRHPLYGKFVRHRTTLYAHDEDEVSHVGDRVEIVESRPRSAKKRWELVRVIEESHEVSAAEIKEAVAEGSGEKAES